MNREKHQNHLRNLWTVWFAVVSISISNLMILYILWLLFKECLKVIKKRNSARYLNLERFQGPRGYPVIGNLLDFLCKDFYNWGSTTCKRWGDHPVRLWRFGQPVILISSMEFAIQVLSSSNLMMKVKDVHPFCYIFKRADVATTSLCYNKEVCGDILQEESSILIGKFENYSRPGESVDVLQLLHYLAICLFRVTARRNFGSTVVSCRSDSEIESHVNALQIISKNLNKRILSPYFWQHNDSIYYSCTKEGKETKNAANLLGAFCREAIVMRRLISVNNLELENHHRACFLEMLLNLVDCGKMTMENAIHEMTNVLIGCYIPAVAMSWTMVALSLHPHHQQQVYVELAKMFECSGAQHVFTASDVDEMRCLELCMREAVRLFPPKPLLLKRTVSDVTLKDGRVLPEDVEVLIFTSLINRDSSYFHEPEVFRPERHLENNLTCEIIVPEMGIYLRDAKTVLAHLLASSVWQTDVTSLENVTASYQGFLFPTGIHFKIRKRISD